MEQNKTSRWAMMPAGHLHLLTLDAIRAKLTRKTHAERNAIRGIDLLREAIQARAIKGKP